MIAIVSPSLHERTAFAALCGSRGWITTECDSLRAFKRALLRMRPRVVLTRRRLGDGFSDDVIAALTGASISSALTFTRGISSARVVVLMGANTPSAVEARQVALGVDCVQRDPVRTDVLVEYLEKYRQASEPARNGTARIVLKPFAFAGVTVDPVGRQLRRGNKAGHLTPHEVDLVELLVQSEGGILTYETLYSDILGRRFRGDTSNMRVLLGKLTASARAAGVQLREWVEVVPKMGYRYRPPEAVELAASKARRALRAAPR